MVIAVTGNGTRFRMAMNGSRVPGRFLRRAHSGSIGAVRDARGWYRMPGFWTHRRDRAVIETDLTVANQPAWRTTGPPSDHPDDTPKPAPGPDFFFVPGHYRPNNGQLDWRPGFWARVQPGWDWVPLAWVVLADGWQFRDGTWVPDPTAAIATLNGYRRNTAPPPPPAAESTPNASDKPPGTLADGDGDRLARRVPDDEFEDAPVVVIGPRVACDRRHPPSGCIPIRTGWRGRPGCGSPLRSQTTRSRATMRMSRIRSGVMGCVLWNGRTG